MIHPIKQIIDSQYGFLGSMLDRFPTLLDEWIKKQEGEMKQLAEDVAEGNYDIYCSVYRSEILRIESCYVEEELFNFAMLIMVYSYYEASLLKLAREVKIQEKSVKPSDIAQHFGKNLEKEMLNISDFLYNKIRTLRNQLCHNNQGTLFARNKEEEVNNIKELEEERYLTIYDGRIASLDRTFIKKVLDDEHKLLLRLAEICDFKTKYLGRKDDFESMNPLESR